MPRRLPKYFILVVRRRFLYRKQTPKSSERVSGEMGDVFISHEVNTNRVCTVHFPETYNSSSSLGWELTSVDLTLFRRGVCQNKMMRFVSQKVENSWRKTAATYVTTSDLEIVREDYIWYMFQVLIEEKGVTISLLFFFRCWVTSVTKYRKNRERLSIHELLCWHTNQKLLPSPDREPFF